MGDICARNVQSLHFYCFICWVYCGYGSQHPDRLVPEQQNYYPDYITEQTDAPLGLFCTSWMFRILPAKFFFLLFQCSTEELHGQLLFPVSDLPPDEMVYHIGSSKLSRPDYGKTASIYFTCCLLCL